mmetsp:Transcript_6351/g.8890  ORF Transcript_6351/g.8890 Transcript_6351/m.8890 type:complete len:98 (-) Transcript_6351:620-913(-)
MDTCWPCSVRHCSERKEENPAIHDGQEWTAAPPDRNGLHLLRAPPHWSTSEQVVRTLKSVYRTAVENPLVSFYRAAAVSRHAGAGPLVGCINSLATC